MPIIYIENNIINFDQLCSFFKLVKSEYVKNPIQLSKALQNSDFLLTAWEGDNLVGLCNTVTDGYLFVYMPFFCILPESPVEEISREFISRIKLTYSNFSEFVVMTDKIMHQTFLSEGFKSIDESMRFKA